MGVKHTQVWGTDAIHLHYPWGVQQCDGWSCALSHTPGPPHPAPPALPTLPCPPYADRKLWDDVSAAPAFFLCWTCSHATCHPHHCPATPRPPPLPCLQLVQAVAAVSVAPAYLVLDFLHVRGLDATGARTMGVVHRQVAMGAFLSPARGPSRAFWKPGTCPSQLLTLVMPLCPSPQRPGTARRGAGCDGCRALHAPAAAGPRRAAAARPARLAP